MKSSNDPKMHIWLCAVALLAASLPSATANKMKAVATIVTQQEGRVEASGSLVTLLGSIATGTSVEGDPYGDYGDQALRGSGGGYDVLKARKEGKSDVYRPWKTRFDLQPFDAESPKYKQPENRMAYRRFYTGNPEHAQVPNSRDREVQSSVVMVFGLTALGAIIAAILIVDQLQVLGADELSSLRYQHKMVKVVVYAALPWLLLGGWLLNIFIVFVGSPMRNPTSLYEWQCSAMTWFLLVAPAINLLYFSAHALWISKLSFSVEKQAPMGRMFNLADKDMPDSGADGLTRIFNFASHSVTRLVLLLLEVACAVFGYFLVTYRYGRNSQTCQPEVYWTTTALVASVTIVIVFTALAFICSVLIRVFSVSGWVQDFAESFRGGPIFKKGEEIWVTSEEKEDKVQEEEDYNEWATCVQEERQKHDEIMQEHYEYQKAVSELLPARAQQTLPRFEEDDEPDDEPLIIWPDDASSTAQFPTARSEPIVPASWVGAPVVSRTIIHSTRQLTPTSSLIGTPPVASTMIINSGPLLGSRGPTYNMAPPMVYAPTVVSQEQAYGKMPPSVGGKAYAEEGEEETWGEWLLGESNPTLDMAEAESAGMVPPSTMGPSMAPSRFIPGTTPGMVPPSMAPSGYISPGPPGTMPPGSLPFTTTLPPSNFQQPQPMLSGMLPYGYNSMYAPGPPSLAPGTPPGSVGLPPPSTLGPSSFRQFPM